MKRPLQIILALVAATAPAAAQGVTPTPADTSRILLAPKPVASPLAPNGSQGVAYRPASAGVAADISSGLPGYSPPLSAPKAFPSADDKPKNQIIRLPTEMMQRYVVHEHRLPVFRIRDLYTPKGLIDLSFKEHPGLRVGNFFNLNANLALNKIQNEERFAERQDLVDTTLAMAAGGDTQEASAMQQAIIDESFENAGQEGPVGLK